MSDEEFDLLDELYFVISFTDLQQELKWEGDRLENALRNLFEKDWVRIFDHPDNPREVAHVGQIDNWRKLYFLATKEGLKVHNS